MTITLTTQQRQWLEAEVSAGHFASVEEAVRFAVDHLFGPLDTGDLSWAGLYLDEARAQIARGEIVTREELKTELAERIKSLR